MRKLIVSMNVSLDGFMAGPDCELDWHFQSWTSEMAESACEQLSKADTLLLGRITYLAMAGYWPDKAMDLSFAREDIDFAEMMNKYTKIVFSKTLSRLKWHNARLATGDMAAEVTWLKKQPGRNIMLYGSGSVASALTCLGLVDEYHIWVHPVTLGNGKPLFKSLPDTLPMKLFKTTTFRSGVIILSYQTG